MNRTDGRKNGELRTINVVPHYIAHPDGSCLIEFGKTRVICTAVIEETVPPFLKGSGKGWVTAEYGMLPGSTETRISREKSSSSGRTFEIQRLIGRSLRAVVDTNKLGERTVKVDCDVIQADGGTRTAAITGGFIALGLALAKCQQKGFLTQSPLKNLVAAVSVGIKGGEMLLDLKYDEDSTADMDMNVVMVGNGDFVEVQGTAEGAPFSHAEMNELLELARDGINELFTIQKKFLPALDLIRQ